jgi:deoxyribose-phosphate aldolase
MRPGGYIYRLGKIQNQKELLGMGWDELDMVINIGMLRSGQY